LSSLTVVIPTYNRAPVLRKALQAYLAQQKPSVIQELLVVDDGSTDDTHSVVGEISLAAPFPIRYFRQENKGPAAARNVGIREARGEIILFTDDDIIPGPSLIAEHLEWHGKFPQPSNAVLGQVTWALEVNPTPFMKWYGSDGPLFSFAHFAGGAGLEFHHFYTCNLSLKTSFLRDNGTFDEDFKSAAFEDIELGYRLEKAGMRLMYNPDALAYHRQHISFEEACRRAKRTEAAERLFRSKEAGISHFSQLNSTVIYVIKQRLRKSVQTILAPPLSPLKRLMDLPLPLPWSVYRTMFRVFRQ
jgi:glycosyltransferase involved in cell wall biosynthesis